MATRRGGSGRRPIGVGERPRFVATRGPTGMNRTKLRVPNVALGLLVLLFCLPAGARAQDCARLSFSAPLRFDLYQGRLAPGQDAVFERIASRLRACPGTTVELQVHTDTVRTAGFNLRQSHAVAQELKLALARLGVDPNRLVACGYGEERPNVTPGQWQGSPNERVEVRTLANPAAHRCPNQRAP